MLSDIAGIDMVAVGYIECKAFRSIGLEEVWKAKKRGEASRKSIESAERVCEVAIIDATTSKRNEPSVFFRDRIIVLESGW